MDRKEVCISKQNNNRLLNQPSPLLSVVVIRVSITCIQYDEPTPRCCGSFGGHGLASGNYYNQDIYVYIYICHFFPC